MKHAVDVLIRHQQVGRELAECLLGAVTQQCLGLRAPEHDPPVRIQHPRRHAQHIEQPARLRRTQICTFSGAKIRLEPVRTHRQPLLPPVGTVVIPLLQRATWSLPWSPSLVAPHQ